jgi:hypothetical protein
MTPIAPASAIAPKIQNATASAVEVRLSVSAASTAMSVVTRSLPGPRR